MKIIVKQNNWKADKTTKMYQRYLKRRKKSMIKTSHLKLEKKNKQMPIEYKKRNYHINL